MSELVKCEKCNGRKKVYGFGGIEKTCSDCKGLGVSVGKVSAEIKTDNVVSTNGEPVSVKKKPGRRPRLQNTLEV